MSNEKVRAASPLCFFVFLSLTALVLQQMPIIQCATLNMPTKRKSNSEAPVHVLHDYSLADGN
jgi:hypothetical protein